MTTARNRIDPALAPYNIPDAVGETLPARVYVADCTLRNGEQHAGLVFSPETKLRIARVLADLGVYEIEAGMPAVSPDDQAAVEAIAGAGLGCRVSALARAIPSDIYRVAATGSWDVRISLPAGTLQLKHKLRLTPRELIEKAVATTTYAKNKGLYVIFSPYDTPRADETLLRSIIRTVAGAQSVDRIRIVDTAGMATPHAMRYLVRLTREESGDSR